MVKQEVFKKPIPKGPPGGGAIVRRGRFPKHPSPANNRRMQRIIDNLPEIQEWTVERNCITSQRNKEGKEQAFRTFEIKRFSILAESASEAKGIADEAKFNFERKLGHHTGGRT